MAIIRLHDEGLTHRFRHCSLLSDPLVYIEAFCEALKEESKRLEEEDASREGKNPRMASSIMEAPRQQWFVGFTPNLGPSHHVSPRGLTTELLRTLVVVEGIVIKCIPACSTLLWSQSSLVCVE